MDFCEVFAQELRIYKLIAHMGVAIAFAHIPPIYICKQMHFFNNTLLLFTNRRNTL